MYIPLKIYTLHWKHVQSRYSRYVCYGAEKTAVGVWAGTWGCRTVWVWRADRLVIRAVARQRGVTWVLWPPGALRELPLVMKSDCLIHGKQKCCQSSRMGHQRQQRRQPRDSSVQRPGPQYTGGSGGSSPLCDIDDGRMPGFYSTAANGL